jgi:hypothetical protein
MASRVRVTAEQKAGKQLKQGAPIHSDKKCTKQKAYTVAK